MWLLNHIEIKVRISPSFCMELSRNLRDSISKTAFCHGVAVLVVGCQLAIRE